MVRKYFAVFIIFTALACSVATGQYFDDEYDVPFVPTANGIVEEMLKISGVTGDDFIYDLGCGDGRIVITAAKKYGARGVGIDINPERIKESEENARNAGVTDLVSFAQEDLFETDFSKASVVSMYLLPSVNLKLRPELFKQLRPGSRIVSHDFDMGAWAPDSTVVLDIDFDELDSFSSRTIYYWLLPANVSGIWTWGGNGNEGASYKLMISQKFQKLKAVLGYGETSPPIQNFEISGDTVILTVDRVENNTRIVERYAGRVDGDTIRGEKTTEHEGELSKSPWLARRDPATKVRIDVSVSE